MTRTRIFFGNKAASSAVAGVGSSAGVATVSGVGRLITVAQPAVPQIWFDLTTARGGVGQEHRRRGELIRLLVEEIEEADSASSRAKVAEALRRAAENAKKLRESTLLGTIRAAQRATTEPAQREALSEAHDIAVRLRKQFDEEELIALLLLAA